jgi:hypothetical protein
MASLQGNTIKDTYKSLLKVADNGELEATEQEITDGNGNGTGVSLNTSGDVIATGTVSFASLKDTDENITITKFVDEADGIAANDNDTSIPTSAAVKDYVDTNITAQDLDITDGTNVGAVDLDSQLLTFTGAGTVSTVVSGQTVTITGSGTDLSNTPSANNVLVESSDGNNTTLGAATTSVAGVMTSADKSKLDGIETGAEVNPDASEIKTLYESNANTNAFTDAEQTKLGTIESGAEVNPDAAEVKSLYESNANTNAFTDAEQTKLANIEAGAQVNTVDSVNTQTGVVVLDADDISDTSTANKFVTSTEITKLGNITVTQAVDLDTLESDVSSLQSNKQDISEKNQANGYAPLDAGAKVPIANIPDSVLGQVEYQGTYNASTDTPTLPAASTVKGDYYVVSVAGTYETISYAVGDWIISNGTAWEKVDNTDAVTTVFGRLGNVVANEADYDSFYPLISDLNTTNDNVNALDGRLTTAEGDITAIETKTDFITVTQAVNLDTIESDLTTAKSDITAIETKTDNITVTQPVNLDTMESDIATLQTDKYDKTGGTITGNVTVTGDLSATNIAGTLSTAAQTNITSVGTLSSLAVSGNLTVDTNTLFVDAANNNVFLNKTSLSYATVGCSFEGAGTVAATRADDASALFARNNSAGDVVQFRKDNVTKGSIGISDTGISIYLGGTAAANALDDYEEGTWTPTANLNVTINTIENAYYTKIGNIVTVQAWIKADFTSNPIVFSGLPFNVSGRGGASMSNGQLAIPLGGLVINTEFYGYHATSGTNDNLYLQATYRVT